MTRRIRLCGVLSINYIRLYIRLYPLLYLLFLSFDDWPDVDSLRTSRANGNGTSLLKNRGRSLLPSLNTKRVVRFGRMHREWTLTVTGRLIGYGFSWFGRCRRDVRRGGRLVCGRSRTASFIVVVISIFEGGSSSARLRRPTCRIVRLPSRSCTPVLSCVRDRWLDCSLIFLIFSLLT
jgi:hypothetical protein